MPALHKNNKAVVHGRALRRNRFKRGRVFDHDSMRKQKIEEGHVATMHGTKDAQT
jgi:hypothetical protein